MANRVTSAPPSGSSFFRFLRWLGYALGLILIVALLAPTIIANTALGPWLVSRATGDLPVAMTFKSLSLGWWLPVVIEGIEIRDRAGNSLVQIPRVATENSLLSLAVSPRSIGKIRVEKPHVDVIFAGNTSNFESAFVTPVKSEPAPPPAPRDNRDPSMMSFNVEIEGGTIRIVDQEQNKTWQFDLAGTRLSHDSSAQPPLTGRATAMLVGETNPGTIKLDIDGTIGRAGKGRLIANVKAIPIALAGPILRRGQTDLVCSGRMHGDAVVNWLLAPDGTPTFLSRSRLKAQNLEVRDGPLGVENLLVRDVELPLLQLDYSGTQMAIECRDLTCDLGRISAIGKIDVDRPLLASLSEPGTSVSLDVDLAEIAQQVPTLLNLHRDVKVTAGHIHFDGKSVSSPSGAAWDGKLTTTDIRGMRMGKPIVWPEPLALSFKVRQTANALPQIEELRCQSRFMDLTGSASPTNLKLKGSVNLNQMAAQLGQFVDLSAWAVGGRAEATLAIARPDKDSLTVDADVAMTQFQWGTWNEPFVQMNARGFYAGKQGVLTLDAIQCAAQFGRIDARAKLAKLDSVIDFDAAGTVTYDLAKSETFLKSYLGAGARIQGKDRRDFHLAGPLRPKGTASGAAIQLTSLKGKAGLNWTTLQCYGAVIGPTDLKLSLEGGWLKVDPVATSLNQGKLNLAPNLRLEPAPHDLNLPAGSVIENAKITPAMFASGLGYALPSLANVASADGELSMQLASARIPIDNPRNAAAEGILVLHHAKIGPGPLVTELSGILKTPAPFSVIRENQVKFKVDKGRVYHENLEMILPDNFVVRTSGSVGFDGSLNMTAEMQMPPKLLGNIKLPPAISRMPIRLPITGTVERPHIDQSALRDVLKQVGGDAARDLIQQGIDSGLKKLFRPKN